ncbi:hypothetical protein E4T56_gene5501 [Termitomyces sp. T112]|nr:hypothetical protein E4T56_gene5501 [Termitomyces sp. T112]
MTFSIVEIEDPEVASPTIIHTYNPTIEPDGSLNLSKISWVKKGDIYVCCTSIRGIYTNLMHPSLSPIIPAEKWTPLLRIHNGTAVLLLIRADPIKTSQVHGMGPGSPSSSQGGRICIPALVSSDVSTGPSDSPETLIVVRQIRDFDEEEYHIVRNWTVALETDFSLDPSKLSSIEPGESVSRTQTRWLLRMPNIRWLPPPFGTPCSTCAFPKFRELHNQSYYS